ncbi:uncharacterized protein LOC135816522 [Sycon ciliatum]|uniref:uncharacterized protein LOC135816522 n=1 Tax=Sycon ciliatum TaxID=27933 RepID=UPI0031F72164
MADLLWWAEALTIWNGKSFFLVDEWTPVPDMQLQTDASGTHGYGAFYNGRWLRGEWTGQNENENIEFKEMTLQPRSVRVYMSAIRNLQVELGFAYPSGPTTLLARVLRGIDRSSSTQRHRLPITTPLLREICRHVAVPRMRHPHDKAMLRAAFSLAFHGFFRCGELTAGLRRCDVTISTDQRSLSVNVRSSKTDPDSTGHTVLVGASTDTPIYPVQAMANYLAFRPGGDHLFTYANGQPLTKNAVSSELRNLLPLCGVTDPSAYASHSFRIGAATSAAMAGVPEHIIRIMGRWRSDAVHRYIRAATADTLRVSRQLAAVQSHQW